MFVADEGVVFVWVGDGGIVVFCFVIYSMLFRVESLVC